MSYAKKAVKRILLVFSINIIAAFFGYLIRVILARNLTTSEYGLFFAIFTLINLLVIFRDMGLGSALVKYLPEFQVNKKFNSIKTAIISVISIHLLNSLIIISFLYFMSGFLSNYYFKNLESIQLLFLFSLLFLITTFWDNFRNVFQGLQRMFYFSAMYLVLNLSIVFLLSLSFFVFNLGIESAVISYIIGGIISVIIFLPVLFRVFPFFKYSFVHPKSVIKNLLNFGIFVTLSGISSMIILYVDTLILTYFRPLSEVGIYNAVVPTVMMLNFFGVSIFQVIYPMFSEMWARKKKSYLKSGIIMLHKYFFVFVLPIALILFSLPKLVLNLLFGSAYIGGALTLQILVLGVIFIMMYSINSTIFGVTGNPQIGTKIMLFGAILNLILNLILIPPFGIVGAAFTSLVSYFVIFLISTFKVREIFKINLQWMQWFKTLLVGFIFVCIIFFLKFLLVLNPYLEAIICLTIAGLVYLLLIWLLKIIDVAEIKRVFF